MFQVIHDLKAIFELDFTDFCKNIDVLVFFYNSVFIKQDFHILMQLFVNCFQFYHFSYNFNEVNSCFISYHCPYKNVMNVVIRCDLEAIEYRQAFSQGVIMTFVGVWSWRHLWEEADDTPP